LDFTFFIKWFILRVFINQIPMITTGAVEWLEKYHRLTNYISAAQLYLKSNQLLETELLPEHIKLRILGHWGTVPGLNLVYGGLSYLADTRHQEILQIVGPGHGVPSILSNLLIEGTLEKYYPEYPATAHGISKLISNFSWPGGFPSHSYPGTPGNLHEGGELGYSLGVAAGAVLDNPNLMVACVIGDGEAETGALAASWHSNKFLNPQKDGAVLPILHLNGYKISGPTIFGSMSQQELEEFFYGLGWHPLFVDQYQNPNVYQVFLSQLDSAYDLIRSNKLNWKSGTHPVWPVLVLKTKKGWTGPLELGGVAVEDNNLSHGIPLKNPAGDPAELKILSDWLKSYDVLELFDEKGIKPEVLEFIPEDKFKIGLSPYAVGGNLRKELVLPDLKTLEIDLCGVRGCTPTSEMEMLSRYLAKVIQLNPNNFRIFSPDESESNKLEAVLETTSRQYIWPTRQHDLFIHDEGRMLEILSEQTLQSWMQGYNLTGRHGVFISYEAFLSIIISQIDQYLKFLNKSLEFSWRTPLPSLNYISTSTCWRQDHNGFSHQNPGLINSLLVHKNGLSKVFFPADSNTYLANVEECLSSTNRVNLIISGKTDLPQWLSFEEAKRQAKAGVSQWDWAGSEDRGEADIILASCGDYQTLETLAGLSIIKELLPNLKLRYININWLTAQSFEAGTSELPLFGQKQPILINFHGYPEALKQLLFDSPLSQRTKILGYIEQGTTTTPYDMQIANHTSRWHVVKYAAQMAFEAGLIEDGEFQKIAVWFATKIDEHEHFIKENGDDLPEIKNWRWS
jgi:xylulose-5-phosphate/fructose-6-phosphate phosphoketolase